MKWRNTFTRSNAYDLVTAYGYMFTIIIRNRQQGWKGLGIVGLAGNPGMDYDTPSIGSFTLFAKKD
jgi:hypothetical protein